MSYGIRSEGIPELQKAFSTIGDVSSKKVMRRALFEGAKIIRDSAKSLVPFRSQGNTRGIHIKDTIRVKLKKKRGAAFISSGHGGVNLTYSVGPNYKKVPYANPVMHGQKEHIIEAGSQKATARRLKAAIKIAGRQGTLSGDVKLPGVLHFKIGGKDIFVRKVTHPSTLANPFMDKAFLANSNRAMTTIKEKISTGIDKEFKKMVK